MKNNYLPIKILKFFKTFKEYKNVNNKNLFNYIKKSYDIGQYKLFYDKNNNITGYLNWAFIDDIRKNYFYKYGKVLNWQCGHNMFYINCLNKGNMIEIHRWCRKHTLNLIGYDKNINWIRIKKNKITKINSWIISEENTGVKR